MRGALHIKLVGLCVALALLVVAASQSTAADVRYVVIVHPDNPASSVSASFLKNAFLKKAVEWSGGEAIRPLDLATKFPERQRFTEQILRKTPSQLKNYWNQQIFSGKGVPPPEAETVSAAIAYVLANPGAVAYIPAGAEPGGAKVIAVQ